MGNFGNNFTCMMDFYIGTPMELHVVDVESNNVVKFKDILIFKGN